MSRPRTSADERPRHLIYGEGPSDAAFLRYLKSLFAPRGSGFEIRADGDEGGDPLHVLRRCLRYRGGSEFTTRTILMDTDLPWHPEEVVARAKGEKITLLKSEPCLEGLLLAILSQPVPGTAKECKREFRGKWITEAAMLSAASYTKHFSEAVLRARGKTIPTLDALIRIMEGGKG
jgi:hypothetical protein